MRIWVVLLLAAVALAAPAQARRVEPSSAVPISNPGEWVSSDDYPMAALSRGESGTTGFVLTVNEAGHVTDCEITQSSGSQSLDQATCDRLRLRAQFTPAMSASGRPVAGSYRNRVRWVNPNGEAQLALARALTMPGLLVVVYKVDADGTVSECRVERSDGAIAPLVEQAKLGQAGCGKGQTVPPTDASGHAVTRRMRITVKLEEIAP